MDSTSDNQPKDTDDSDDSLLATEYPETPTEHKPISSRWDLQESWTELEEATPSDIEKGEVISGTVVAIQDQYIVVDVGAKFEGVVPRNEFADGEDLPAQGEEIKVAVVHVDDERGLITLSKKRADYERAWRELYQARETGEVLSAMVAERVKGGLRVDVGMPGFIPASHVAIRDVRQLDKLVGRSLQVKVIEVNQQRNQIILSHRQVVEEERERRRQETLSKLKEGIVCEGRVRNLTNYGAFIDLGAVDGLLHISEMSWTHVNHPSEVLKSGEIIRVMVLSIEDDGQRISLGRRQILPDPWQQAAKQLEVNCIIDAVVTRVVSAGAFARLAGVEVEGFIPLREMSSHRISSTEEAVSKGQQVQVKLLDLNAQAHRMTLSLVGAETERDLREYEEHMKEQQGSTVKLGDQFGDMLEKAKENMPDGEPAEQEPAAEQPESGEGEACGETEVSPTETPKQPPEETAEEEAAEVETCQPESEAEETCGETEVSPTETPKQSPEETAEEEAAEAETPAPECEAEEPPDAPGPESEEQEES